MGDEETRYYLVLKATSELRRAYAERSAGRILDYISDHVFRDERPKDPPFRVVDLPSNDISWGGDERQPPAVNGLVVSLAVRKGALNRLDGIVKRDDAFLGGSADIPYAGADHWCPREAADPIFADRSAAQRLIRADYLASRPGTDGKGVNIVVVDQGLDRDRLRASYGAGWRVGPTKPGETRTPGRPDGHGMMIARNILAVAPAATLFDLPLVPTKTSDVPSRISDIPAFLSLAQAAFDMVLADIADPRKGGKWPGPWILVNPWGIYDQTSEVPKGSYTNNPNNPFNVLVAGAVKQGIDIVFAAGNCGQFCPDMRCGPNDHGPGHSIFGANALHEVLTVGAVRADAMWLGYSSQGPGQPNLAHDKPDICATSQFRENEDAQTVNTGSSSACALAAGVIAALRSRWDSKALPPDRLKATLNATARKTFGAGWDNRFGHGILDAKAAFDALAAA